MDILSFNIQWMIWNSILAMLPIGFAYFYFKTKRTLYRILLAVLWFLFIPNSLYIISDMEHIVYQWGMVDALGRIFLVIQYAHLEIIGLTTFLLGMYAFEKELRRIYKKHHRKVATVLVISMNFLIGFAMVLGKVERVNSWDVFTATERVVGSALNVLSSDQLVGLMILFGLFGNFFYFLFRDPAIKFFRRYMRLNS